MRLPAELPRPVKDTDFRSRLRGPEVAARVGTWLAVCFGTAFLTGVWSHYAQSTPDWLTMPTRPVNLYRVTQGLHIVAGSAAVPLLLVKLWSVYPRLFLPIPIRPSRDTVLKGLERLSIGVLVAAAIFQLVTGLMNSSQWYPWAFSFRPAHFAVAWLAIGALLVHIAVKLPVIRRSYAEPVSTGEPDPGDPGRDLFRAGHCCARRGSRLAWRCCRPPVPRCRCCATSRCSPCAAAMDRRACRSTGRHPLQGSPRTWWATTGGSS